MKNRIVVISDTHNKLDKVELPEANILIHAGDFTGRGTIDEVCRFAKHLEAVKSRYNHVVIVPGNHDQLFETEPHLARSIIGSTATVLMDSSIEIDGIVIYGTPYVPVFNGWAFERSDEFREVAFSNIPKTDILISHSPPKGVLDIVPRENYASESVGCEVLYKYIQRVMPTLSVFGHIHESYGHAKINGITYVNAAICNEKYRPTNKAIELDFYTDEGCFVDCVKIY